MAKSECDRCGKAVQRSRYIPKNGVFCGKECRDKTNLFRRLRQCEACFALFVSENKHKKTCSEECAEALRADKHPAANVEYFNCEHCGKLERKIKGGKRSHRFCSRDCAFKSGVMRQNCLSGKGGVEAANTKQRLEAMKRRVRAVLAVKSRMRCRKCGALKTEHEMKHAGECNKCISPDLAYVKRGCVDCGKPATMANKTRSQYCSECRVKNAREAARRANKKHGDNHRHRARKYGGEYQYINKQHIFERDRWKCQLCGRKVSKKWSLDDDRSPELDHIIPLSKGGAHKPHNVQCACKECNQSKGDSVQGQLLLPVEW